MKKIKLRTLAKILVGISGTLLTVSTSGLAAIPALAISISWWAGAIGSAIVIIDDEIKKEESIFNDLKDYD